jgi:hypothetical protein
MSEWGLAKDEFMDNGHWPHQIYVREARRMLGEYVTTEHECLGNRQPPRPVGMGSYGMDSHNVRRFVTKEGFVQNEGDVGVGAKVYGIDYGSLTPNANECTNLLVPVCLSSSHIAFGSIRMEPVFMLLGQSAATAAALAIDTKTDVQRLDYTLLRERLIADGQRISVQDKLKPISFLKGVTPEILVDDTDTDQIESHGNWVLREGNHYKTGAMFCARPEKGTFFRFLPKVKTTGKYRVYYYCTYNENPTPLVTLAIDIQSASGMKEVVFNPRENSGDWKDLGVYEFVQGQTVSITVNGDKSSGPLLADAVILHPEK